MDPLTRAAIAVALLAAWPAAADTVTLPAATLDRSAPIMAIWTPSSPVPGTLRLDWTDAAGRLVERHRLTLDEPLPEAAIRLDLRRAVVADNHLEAVFAPRGGGPPSRAEADFIVPPPPGWPGYQVLLWQDPPAGAGPALRSLGITGTKLLHPLSPDGRRQAQRYLAAGLRWYDENLATDFYAAYHRWRPGLPVTWAMDRVRALQRAAPDDPAVFTRDPGLSDPAWLATIRARLSDIAARQARYRPLFLSLGDETGIADLSAAWDFDLSPDSLAAMREWLRGRYRTLPALNHAWGTAFASWDAVRPALTDAAVASDAAVPSWMDFKAWMDAAFARAVCAGSDAVHRGDPAALAGLEGAQAPGWGGYDYGRLAGCVDVMEIYDLANAIEIARSLDPRLRVLTTSTGSGPAELRRLWHMLMLGSVGTIVWDDAGQVIRPDGTPGPRGLALAPLFRTLTGALGVQILAAQPVFGQVAILYSQASFRLGWLLERRRDAAPWQRRDAAAENADTPGRAATRRAARLLAGLGAEPRWITPGTLASGRLLHDGTRLLVLPDSIALSDAEVAAIRRFAGAGGMVLADVPPGAYDALGRARTRPPLAGLVRFPASLRVPQAAPDEMAALLARAAIRRPVSVTDPDGRPAAGLDIRLLRSGGALIVAIQRQDDAPGPRPVTLHFPAPIRAAPLGGGAAAPGPVTRLDLQLDPVTPALLVLSATSLPGPTLSAPSQALAGSLVPVRLGLRGPTPIAAQMLRLRVRDPSGAVVPELSRTVPVTQAGTVWQWPVAVNDRPGPWEVAATDAVTGQMASAKVLIVSIQ